MASFLKQFHRTGGTITKIPSNGLYQPVDNVSLNSVGMVEVYPRSAADDMYMLNPEFLVTGQTTERILASCVPRIKDVTKLPLNDANVLLMAIQKASKGNEYTIQLECPKCKTEQEFVYDLDYLLASVMELPDEWKVTLDEENDLHVYLQPWTLADYNKHFYGFFLSMQHASSMDKQLEAGLLSQEQIENERKQIADKYTLASIESLIHGISKITCQDQEEYDKKEILDFLKNCIGSWVNSIDSELTKIHNVWIPDQKHACSSCSHEWDSKPEFNPSTFFGRRSPA